MHVQIDWQFDMFIVRSIFGQQTDDPPQADVTPASPPAQRSPSRSRSPPGAPGRARAFSPRRSVGQALEKRAFSPRRSVGNSAAPLRRSVGNNARRNSDAKSLRRRSKAAAHVRKSFAHQQFSNPHAETCWLSCLFQSLWHSVVFHNAFEQILAPSKHTPSADERLILALQRTWAQYQAAASAKATSTAKAVATPAAAVQSVDKENSDAQGASAVDPVDASAQLVPSEDLADAFGEGYGDMSEALACLQQELSASGNPAIVELSDLVAMLPVSIADQGDDDDHDALVWPTPERAWQQAHDWGMAALPLIAVDIVVPFELEADECGRLAEIWLGDDGQDLAASAAPSGQGHRVVALVCFMFTYRHYVAFCRRQRDPTRCIFFNDLPMLATGTPKELAWSDVPEICSKHQLTPRLALYESRAHAATYEPQLPPSAAA